MNKRTLHHYWRRLGPSSLWILVAAFVVSATITAFALRSNNLGMIRLRDAVLQADKDNGDVETALRNLREFVYAHMNTDLASGPNAIRPPIQLKYRYDRLASGEAQRVADQNKQIYTQAQTECERLFPNSFSGSGRVPCIKDYVSQHGVKTNPIPDSLYKFDFISPAWSPDLAGWSLLISIILLVLIMFRVGLGVWVRHELKRDNL
jgi:hypothetical protein